LLKLWPGNWREQLKKLNAAIDEANKKARSRKIQQVDEDEWWSLWGIIILAAKVGKGGVTHVSREL